VQPLTNLRALTVSGDWEAPIGGLEGSQTCNDELNKFLQLQHLQLCDTHPPINRGGARLSAAAHLPSLRCAGSLTHLACGVHLVDWDDAAIHTLSRGLPRLSSLALNIGRSYSPTAAAADTAPDPTATILEAISQHTALTALDLNLDHPCSDPCTFQPLSSLRLASCRMHLGQNCDTASLLEALAVQGSLRQLRLYEELQTDSLGALTCPCMQHLAMMAGSLELLDLDVSVNPAANLLEAVGKLTNLKALRLDRLPGAQEATWVRRDVMCLLSLRSVEVLAIGGNAPLAAVMGVVSGLVGLKELSLCGSDKSITGSDLWQLLSLRPHLTRLVLGFVSHVVGPGYAALRFMSGLPSSWSCSKFRATQHCCRCRPACAPSACTNVRFIGHRPLNAAWRLPCFVRPAKSRTARSPSSSMSGWPWSCDSVSWVPQ
jgi:hypothetical protein